MWWSSDPPRHSVLSCLHVVICSCGGPLYFRLTLTITLNFDRFLLILSFRRSSVHICLLFAVLRVPIAPIEATRRPLVRAGWTTPRSPRRWLGDGDAAGVARAALPETALPFVEGGRRPPDSSSAAGRPAPRCGPRVRCQDLQRSCGQDEGPLPPSVAGRSHFHFRRHDGRAAGAVEPLQTEHHARFHCCIDRAFSLPFFIERRRPGHGHFQSHSRFIGRFGLEFEAAFPPGEQLELKRLAREGVLISAEN